MPLAWWPGGQCGQLEAAGPETHSPGPWPRISGVVEAHPEMSGQAMARSRSVTVDLCMECFPREICRRPAAEFSQHAAQVLQVLSAERALNSAESGRLMQKIRGISTELAIPGWSEYISTCC